MMVLFYLRLRALAGGGGVGAESHRACGRAVRARRVRRDLSSGRHRDADRAGDRRAGARSPSTACAAMSARRWRPASPRRWPRASAGAAAFLVPGVICVATGVVYLRLVPGRSPQGGEPRHVVADVPLAPWVAATIFGALHRGRALRRPGVQHHLGGAAENRGRAARHRRSAAAGRRRGDGGVSCAGRWRSSRSAGWWSGFRRIILFAVIALLQFVGVVWAAYAQRADAARGARR